MFSSQFSIPLLLASQLVPESARYYVVNGKISKAEAVIRTVAKYNCKIPPKVGIFWRGGWSEGVCFECCTMTYTSHMPPSCVAVDFMREDMHENTVTPLKQYVHQVTT